MSWEHFEPTCAAVKANKPLMDLFEKNMAQYPELVDGEEDFAGGASDVGNVSQVVPTVHPMIKMVTNEAGCHTTEFRDALQLPYAKERGIEAIKILVETGLDLLEDPKLAYSLKTK
jgi:metal-dependent amidase/aminoacylase/carboxypeptidase family protein